jgi:hypothetical protein
MHPLFVDWTSLFFLFFTPRTRQQPPIHPSNNKNASPLDFWQQCLLQQRYSTQISPNEMSNENILCITVTNLSVNGPDKTVRALKNHFQQYGLITDIWQHYLDSTNWMLPSVAVYIDITNNPKLMEKIDRCSVILGQRTTLRWRNAPLLCGYCKNTDHVISACAALRKKKSASKPVSSKKTGQGNKRLRTDSPLSAAETANTTKQSKDKMPEVSNSQPVEQ